MQGLGTAKNGRQRLNRGPDHVVVGLLGSEGDTGGLGMEAEHPRAGVFRLRSARAMIPAHIRRARAELGDLLEEVALGHEEEGEAARYLVHGHTCVHGLTGRMRWRWRT